MKKRLFTALAILVLAVTPVLISGCKGNIKKFGGTTNGIYLFEDLSVQDVVIEDFDQDVYSVEEFSSLLASDLQDYNDHHEFRAPAGMLDGKGNVKEDARVKAPITLVSMEPSGKQLNLQLMYATADDYYNYNKGDIEKRGGKEFTVGTFADPDPRISSASFRNEKGEPVSADSFSGSGYRYVILDFDAVVYGDGDIVAFTPDLTYNDSTKSVQISAGKLGIVIFK